MNQNDVTVYAVGDIHPNRDNPESIFELSVSTLKKADIRFGTLETNFSQRRNPQMWTSHDFIWVDPKNHKALTYAGFDVLSFATTKTLNLGIEGLFDTLDLLHQKGIRVIGAGRNIEEARRPAVLEKKGTRVAFLAYSTLGPKGYEAGPDKPGLAPVRISTFYEPRNYQPGTPPRIITLTNKEDLEAMQEDIKKARAQADTVIVSMHWGLVYESFILAMYEPEVGHAAIDAGADLVLGTHPHLLKGIEVYKGKVIFYSLGNFAFDFPSATKHEMFTRPDFPWQWERTSDYPSYGFPPDARKTIIVKCLISDNKIARVSFIPAMVNKQAQPEILTRSDERSSEVLDYIKRSSDYHNFNTRFTWEGEEVVIR